MTQFYYLAAKIPLQGGFFGDSSRKRYPRTEVDEAGIYIENLKSGLANVH
ncbi:hypothetical protein PJ311_10365 [Bacillus sp. CLL-7-23]|uniref:Uncharacterized protein n=1 Tax=Bacillus changyiensis TaxID=3004103 RepID=A0ABT4X3Y3_9BACI|nr:hypothetical protein [Bacillus changyiensis]MDA7027011.1 hypothetical protein [Bacillus changyiensis]